jgi:hypothetical protein
MRMLLSTRLLLIVEVSRFDLSEGGGPGERHIRLPEAPEGLIIKIPAGMPHYKRRQLQEALNFVLCMALLPRLGDG